MKSRLRYTVVVALLLIFLSNSLVFANTIDVENLKKYDFDGTLTQNRQGNQLVKNTLTLVMYLLLILGICLLAFYTTRWVSKHQRSVAIKSKYMEVIDTLSLGSESGIYIVRAPQGLLMLGVSQKHICILEKLGTEEKEMIEESEAGFLTDRSFANQLERFLLNKKSVHQNKNGDKT